MPVSNEVFIANTITVILPTQPFDQHAIINYATSFVLLPFHPIPILSQPLQYTIHYTATFLYVLRYFTARHAANYGNFAPDVGISE